jgi:hypothetical protein
MYIYIINRGYINALQSLWSGDLYRCGCLHILIKKVLGELNGVLSNIQG